MKKIRILVVLIIINILFNIFFCSFQYSVKAVSQSVSSAIDSIDSNKYPGIKEKIKSLQAEHPNWKFKILYTGISWKDVITYEYTGHGSSPKNLVPASSSYGGDWVCGCCGDRVYDSGSWKCASISAIKYMMDPRASLNSSDVFQFLELSYNEQSGYSKDVLKKMLQGSFLDNDKYINSIMESCKRYKVNPYYIAARILQEQGKSGSVLTKGQGYNGQYVGYYNVFNIGATGGNKERVILNGLSKAKSNGWTNLEASIDGGIKVISSSYIAVGQNTMYFQKFDVDNSDGNMYWHQYMQNILAAQNEGATLRRTINDMNAINYAYTFIIPVYENMPTSVSARPSTTSKSQTTGVELVRINVTDSLNMRDAPSGSGRKGSLRAGEIATRLEKASSKVNGTYWDKILKSDGTVGYVARCTYDYESNYKEYLVHVYGDTNGWNTNSSQNNKTPSNQNTSSNGGTSQSNNTSSSNKLGDVNKDGNINSADALLVLKSSVGLIQVDKTISDVNKDGKVNSADALLILKYSVKLISSF